MANSNQKPVKLSNPPKNPNNVQGTKYYVFNETGNIMMSSTDQNSAVISDSVRDVFAEVSVVFAAMTKAMTTSIDPATKKPYQLYDYEPLRQIIDGSGMFVQVTEESVQYSSESVGVQFSKELIEALLGLATGTGELAFASAMVQSMGNAGLNISQNSSKTNAEIGNIIFVCEYLLGMPVISALVVHLDTKKNQQTLSVGPCVKESSTSTTLTMQKDTYLFVTPKFIKEYASDLMSVETSAEYSQFIDYLKGIISGKSIITAVTLSDGATNAPQALVSGTTYIMVGENFGGDTGTLELGGTSLSVNSWSDNAIEFVPRTAVTTSAVIQLTKANGKDVSATTSSAYTVNAQPS
ncbi:hypothetical protein AB9P05_00465 [Roseivirga sp. BDSF3-8]|uniref:hypothetical protein n=1 Tax=Roseivirga sp. BDSF3-8 TaxID=3241598 RepID=UPI003532472B